MIQAPFCWAMGMHSANSRTIGGQTMAWNRLLAAHRIGIRAGDRAAIPKLHPSDSISPTKIMQQGETNWQANPLSTRPMV